MGLVVDKARPASRPTRGQYVNILQSETEPHIETIDTDGAIGAAPTFPTADDRAHQTGDDAIAFGSNLITDTFVSWTINGGIVDEAGAYRFDASQPGTSANMSQGLSADPTEGQELRITFNMDHDAGPGLTVSVSDAGEVIGLEGIVVGGPDGGNGNVVISRRIPRDMSGAKIVISDVSGNTNALIGSISVQVRDQSL